MALPAKLVTSLVLNKGDGGDSLVESHGPIVETSVWRYDPATEEAIPFDEDNSIIEKRIKLAFQQTPSTPGAFSTDGNLAADDDSVSVTSKESGFKKWPFEQVEISLRGALQEVSALSQSLRTKDTALVRVERAPLSAQERLHTLGLGDTKRSESFEEAEAILNRGTDAIEKEIKLQREYFRQINQIAGKWRLVAPMHSLNSLTPLRSEEPLAIHLESGFERDDNADLVYLRRSPTGAVTLVSQQNSEDIVGEFKAHSVFAELRDTRGPAQGQASTMLKERSFLDPSANFGGLIFPVDEGESLESMIEARFRDAHARGLMRRLDNKYELKLGEDASLRFELVPEKRSFQIINEYDAICSLALHMLERHKTAEQIQAVCMQKLMFRKYCDALAKTPAVGGITWRHDEDLADAPEKVRSYCTIDVGRSGKFAIEFALVAGQLSLEWCTLPRYRPRVMHNYTPSQALAIATEVSLGALVRDLVNLVSKDDTFLVDSIKNDSFRVTFKANGAVVFALRVDIHENVVRLTMANSRGEEIDITADPFSRVRRALLEFKRDLALH